MNCHNDNIIKRKNDNNEAVKLLFKINFAYNETCNPLIIYELFFLVTYIAFNKSEKKLLKYPYISRGFILGDQVPNSHDFSK